MTTSSPARILVVDDEKLIRWSVGERLQRDGYEVLSAESGEQALDLVGANAPDLMLLDVRLPGIDGITTLQRALALQPDVTVLMMSAHSTVDIAVEAMKHGAIDFLVKPFPFQSLDAAVQRALQTARTRRQIAALTSERRDRRGGAGGAGGELRGHGGVPQHGVAAGGLATPPPSSSRARAGRARRWRRVPSTSRAPAPRSPSCR